MRALPLFSLVLLAGCDRGPTTTYNETAADERIECRSGDAAFERVCIVEQTGDMLILRKPDGGFRRLRIEEGRGVVAADGAEPARVTLLPGDRIEVTIGADAFRLPATVRR